MLNHEKSKRLFDEARRYFAGGVGSSGRVKPELGFPIYFEKGMGSKIYDVDGNQYIDYVLAMGPLILGHSPPTVIEAVKRQLDLGTIFGSSVPEEISLSRLICQCFPSVDLVRYTNSASEAVHMVLRLARAYTGRSKILKFEGAYHGWFDDIWISVHPESLSIVGPEDDPSPIPETLGQSKHVLQEILVLPWNRLDVVEKAIQRHGHDISGVIVEPVMCNNGVIPPQDGFLEGLREVTMRKDVLLIFDETITGFRMALGGAQEYYDVKPDLTVFGKGLGGGYPIAGYGGIKDIMSLLEEGKVGHFGTYNSNSLCVTAALATLKELTKEGGAVIHQMTKLGKNFMEKIKEIFVENHIPIILQGPGPFFSTFFTDKPVVSYRDTFRIDRPLYTKFWLGLLDEGVRILQSIRGLWYLSAAHTAEDIEMTLKAIQRVVKHLKSF